MGRKNSNPINNYALKALTIKLDFTGINNGTQQLTLSLVDAAGNTFTQTYSVIVALDKTPPVVTLNLTNDTGASNSDHITNNPSISGKVTDASGVQSVKVSFKADLTQSTDITNLLQTDGTFTLNKTFLTQLNGGQLPDSNYQLYIQATDIYGNTTTTQNLPFQLLTQATTPTNLQLTPSSDTGTSNSDNITKQAQPTVTGIGSIGESIQLIDGNTVIGTTTVGNLGTWQITTNTLVDGIHNLTAKGTDIAGNVSQASTPLNITIDTLPPQVQLAQPLNNAQLVNNSHLTGQLNGTGSAVVSASYQWGNQTAIPLTITLSSFDNQIDFTGISNGSQQLTLSLVDAAGNTFTQTYSVIVALDKTAPVVTLNLTNDTGTSNSDLVTNNPSISGKVTDVSGVQSVKVSFKADLTQSLDITTKLQADGTFTLDKTFLTQLKGGQLIDGSYQLYIQAADIYGNTTTTQNLAFQLLTNATTPTNLQLTPSSDTGSSNSDNITKQNQPTLTGIGSIGESIQLLDGTTVIASTTVGNSGTWQITTPTLVDGIHTVTAKGTDIAGNISPLSTPLNITIDTLPPQVQFSQALDGIVLNATSHLKGQITDTNTVVISYQIDGAPAITIPSSGNQFDVPFNLTGINNGVHQLTVTATDIAGNLTTHTYGVTVAQGPLLTLALLDDTGNSNTDGITSDTTIRGLVANRQAISRLEFALDGNTNKADLTAALQLDGSFRLLPAQLDSLAGGHLAPGAHTLTVHGVLADGTVVGSATLPFTYRPSTLTTPTLTLATASDTGTIGDSVTSLSAVDVIAHSLPGTTVTLGTTSKTTDSNGSATFTWRSTRLRWQYSYPNSQR